MAAWRKGMATGGGLSTVIAEIYEASVEADGLNRLAGVVAGALGTRSGFLALLARPQPGQCEPPAIVGLPSATDNFDDWARGAYAEHYHGCNIWFERGIRAGFPAIVLGQELVPDRELLRSEWYEYCQRLDAFHVLGAQFHINAELSGQLGAHRPRGARPFTETSRRKMSVLLPHVQRALQISVRLGIAEQTGALSLNLLERLGFGVLIVDETRHVLFANRAAERAMAGRGALRAMNGRVSAAGASAAAFDRMIDGAARTSSGEGIDAGGLLNLSMPDGHAFRLLISPLPREHFSFGASTAAVLVLISVPETAAVISPEKLSKALAITAAEAKLLSRMVAGDTLAGYAAKQGISIGTARTHLKHLLSKTGYHRQVDLVRATASDPLLRLGA
jgi:DNA-binding CsgD family transcriptional regulator